MYTIYHNPRCSKSRAGLAYLESKGYEYEIVDYLKNPLSKSTLKEILMKMNKAPQDIIRTQEAVFKAEFKGKNFSDEEWINILLEHPKLIQRPIVSKNYKALLAQPPESINEL